MDLNLLRIRNELLQAIKPEFVFGDLDSAHDFVRQEKFLDQKYKELLEATNPDDYSNLEDKEAAREAKELIDRLYEKAKQLVALGAYGTDRHLVSTKLFGMVEFETVQHQYRLGDPFVQGDFATYHEGSCLIGQDMIPVAIKIADSASDNNLILREARTLKALFKERGSQRKHLPLLFDQFQTEDGRLGLIFRYLENCPDLYTVLEHPLYQKGVPRKHMVWILNRALSALGYVHSLGRMHGNINPSHLMLRPVDHNVFIVGWGHSIYSPVKTGESFTIFDEDFSAPEVKDKGVVLPSADVYSLGICMIHILGGDIKTKEVPDEVEDELARFIGCMVLDSPRQRPHGAWALHSQLNSLVVKLWGPKKFLPFQWS